MYLWPSGLGAALQTLLQWFDSTLVLNRGCCLVGFKALALQARDQWFDSTHPYNGSVAQLGEAMVLETIQYRFESD